MNSVVSADFVYFSLDIYEFSRRNSLKSGFQTDLCRQLQDQNYVASSKKSEILELPAG